MKLLNYKQGTPEWLAMRRQAIGASDAAIVTGKSPYQTRYGLWEQKVLGKGVQESSAMTFGKQNEEPARQLFEQMTGITMFSDRTYAHDEREWQIASLDGISLEQDTIVEIKCANHDDHQIASEGHVPSKYIPQVQHQLAVTNLKEGYYFSYHKGNGIVVEVKRDDAYLEELLQAEEEFYYVNMIGMEAPALCDKDYIEMRDEVWDQISYGYVNVHRQLQELEKKKENLRKELLRLSNGQSCKGNGVVLTKSFRRGLVDYKAIPELSGVDLDKYRKPASENWRINVA